MASAYTVTVSPPSTLPAHLTVRVVVMREDSGDLTPEDIAAAKITYPAREEDARVIGTEKPPKTTGAKARRASSKTTRRAAAKRRLRGEK